MEKKAGEDIEGGEEERQGTLWTATAHIVTAVIGSGVLALPWSTAQLGWIAGPLTLVGFAGVTYYMSTLLANSYRSITGARNHTYMKAVRSYLGPTEVLMCGVAQYVNLRGTLVGYTITASTSMIAVKRSNCFHRNGHSTRCTASGNTLMAVFGLVQAVLSQLPSLENMTWLSVLAATMSFAYSAIGLGLCVAKWASHGDLRGGFGGVSDPVLSKFDKARNMLLALGNIAFAYTFAEVVIEIQDTLKSPPPENKTMKGAAMYGIGLTTIFYISLGCIGYVAFGNYAPGNILTGFGFYEPFWLVDIANIFIIVHLVGAYQVYAQPLFAAIERRIASQWPEAKFIHRVYTFKLLPNNTGSTLSFTMLKLVFRSAFIIMTTLVAMLLPFFNAILGLLGAIAFWPLTVYFPVSMHVAQAGIIRGTARWAMLQGLSIFCLLISLAASVGAVADIVDTLKVARPFKTIY